MALGRNIIANYVGQAVRALLGIALVPVYIEYLGMESYGLIGMFGVLQAWLVLLDLGLRPALGREMARFVGGARTAGSTRDLLRSVEVIGCALSLVVAVASPQLAKLVVDSSTLPPTTVSNAFALMGIVTGLRFIESIYTSSLVGLQRQVQENAISSASAVVRGFGAIAVLAWLAPTIEAFFVWQCVISVASTVALAAAVYASLPSIDRPAHFSRSALVEVWHFAAGMVVLTLQSLLLTNLDKLVLAKLISLEEFGRYTLAGVAANSLGMLTQPVAAALNPRFTELISRDDQTALDRAYHFGSQTVAVLAGSAAVVLMTFGERVLFLWTKSHEVATPVAPVMTVLVLGTMFNSLMWVPYQLQLAHGWTGLATKYNVVAISLVVPALLIFVPRYGPIAAACLWAVLNGSYLVIGIPLMHRRLLPRSMWRWYVGDTIVPIVAALSTAQIFRLLVPVFSSRLLEVAAVGAVSACSLGAAVFSAPRLRESIALRVRAWRPLGA